MNYGARKRVVRIYVYSLTLVVPRLRDSRPWLPLDAGDEFTQPRDHSLAEPCMSRVVIRIHDLGLLLIRIQLILDTEFKNQ